MMRRDDPRVSTGQESRSSEGEHGGVVTEPGGKRTCSTERPVRGLLRLARGAVVAHVAGQTALHAGDAHADELSHAPAAPAGSSKMSKAGLAGGDAAGADVARAWMLGLTALRAAVCARRAHPIESVLALGREEGAEDLGEVRDLSGERVDGR